MTDRELMQKALVHMGINQHAVADQAPHRDVMAYNETMEELRAQLEQQSEPVALIRDGVLRWHIPYEHYARPAWTAHGTHMLYAYGIGEKP